MYTLQKFNKFEIAPAVLGSLLTTIIGAGVTIWQTWTNIQQRNLDIKMQKESLEKQKELILLQQEFEQRKLQELKSMIIPIGLLAVGGIIFLSKKKKKEGA